MSTSERSASPYLLESNAVWMAGAGTGKTHGLVTLCLHLLGGARGESGPVPPSELCVVTFTDKAAAELRARLRSRLEGIIASPNPSRTEPELWETFLAQGRPFPGPAFWRLVLNGLSQSFVGTFHVLAMRLLRRAPAGMVSQGFELLDELEARELVEDTAERVVLDALDAGRPDVTELWKELESADFDGKMGLSLELSRVFMRVREHGAGFLDIPIGDEREIQEGFDEKLAQAKSYLGSAQQLDAAKGSELKPCLGAVASILETLDFETFLLGEPLLALERVLEVQVFPTRGELAKSLKGVRHALLGAPTDKKVLGLRHFLAAHRAIPHERTFRALLGELAERHRAALDRFEAMDFSELLLRARDLLRDDAVFRKSVQSTFKVLLVDEFQDTNMLQLELLTLLKPESLCVVGDRKQSIYEFRGADVTVFEQLARRVEAEGGVRRHLQDNRRSSPRLLTFFNAVFTEVMKPVESPRDWEVGYRPESDDLRAARVLGPAEGACVERIMLSTEEKNAAENRQEEAELLARRLRNLLAPDAPKVVEETGGRRRARPKDVAILFQRLIHVEEYRMALLRHGIPHRVIRGAGFFGAQEVIDAGSLLSLMADGSNAMALVAVLRSPWVGLSDAGLLRLCVASGTPMTLDGVAATYAQAQLSTLDLERLVQFLEWFEPLRERRSRTTLCDILDTALEASGHLAVLAAMPQGNQALTNMDKLLVLARRWDRHGRGDVQHFADHLAMLAEAKDAREAPELSELGDDVVQLMTVHQAKGLEWPVVCVAELGAGGPRGFPDAVLYDFTLGLALRPQLGDEVERVETPRSVAVAAEGKRRGAAESVRKLYVALTRAKDVLILSGDVRNRPSQSWRALLEGVVNRPEILSEVKTLSEADLPPPVEVSRRQISDEARRMAEKIVSRIRRAPVDAPSPEWAVCCLGTPPFTARIRQESALARKAFSRVDFGFSQSAPDVREAHLAQVLRGLGVDEAHALFPSLRASLWELLESPLARMLEGLGEDQCLRGMPFQVPHGDAGWVTGTLDLLFQSKSGEGTVVHLVEEEMLRSPGAFTVALDASLRAARAFVKEDVVLKPAVFPLSFKGSLEYVPPSSISPGDAKRRGGGCPMG